MFTREHYEAIAATMRGEFPMSADVTYAAIAEWGRIVKALAETFSRDNPTFEGDKFIRACFPDPDEIQKQLHRVNGG